MKWDKRVVLAIILAVLFVVGISILQWRSPSPSGPLIYGITVNRATEGVEMALPTDSDKTRDWYGSSRPAKTTPPEWPLSIYISDCPSRGIHLETSVFPLGDGTLDLRLQVKNGEQVFVQFADSGFVSARITTADGTRDLISTGTNPKTGKPDPRFFTWELPPNPAPYTIDIILKNRIN